MDSAGPNASVEALGLPRMEAATVAALAARLWGVFPIPQHAAAAAAAAVAALAAAVGERAERPTCAAAPAAAWAALQIDHEKEPPDTAGDETAQGKAALRESDE